MPAKALAAIGPRNTSSAAKAKASARTTLKPPSSAAAGRKLKLASSNEAQSLKTEALEQLLGYGARRAALTIIDEFLRRMQPYGLRPVEFSILSVIMNNPGVTARQLCAALGLQAPNLVAPLGDFESRGLIERRAHPQDGRAWGLHGTSQGQAFMREAQAQALALELDVAAKLSRSEYNTLLRLLKKVYK
jgi:DNA-binding MarR family transcriptional regulator